MVSYRVEHRSIVGNGIRFIEQEIEQFIEGLRVRFQSCGDQRIVTELTKILAHVRQIQRVFAALVLEQQFLLFIFECLRRDRQKG